MPISRRAASSRSTWCFGGSGLGSGPSPLIDFVINPCACSYLDSQLVQQPDFPDPRASASRMSTRSCSPCSVDSRLAGRDFAARARCLPAVGCR